MITSLIVLTLAGVIIAMVVGMVWYNPSTPMGKLHMRYCGMDKLSPEEQKKIMTDVKPKMPKMYAGQIVLALLTSFAVVFIVSLSIRNGVPASMAAGFVLFNWLCFMVPIIGQGILWGPVESAIAWKKFFSDSACNLVTVLLIALVASLFA